MQQPPSCAAAAPQAFISGWEEWSNLLWFACVLQGVSVELGYVVSFVILITCQESRTKQGLVLAQRFELEVAKTACVISMLSYLSLWLFWQSICCGLCVVRRKIINSNIFPFSGFREVFTLDLLRQGTGEKMMTLLHAPLVLPMACWLMYSLGNLNHLYKS